LIHFRPLLPAVDAIAEDIFTPLCRHDIDDYYAADIEAFDACFSPSAASFIAAAFRRCSSMPFRYFRLIPSEPKYLSLFPPR